jgi:hypothetical protein
VTENGSCQTDHTIRESCTCDRCFARRSPAHYSTHVRLPLVPLTGTQTARGAIANRVPLRPARSAQWRESVERDAAGLTRLRTTPWHRLLLAVIHARPPADLPVRSVMLHRV